MSQLQLPETHSVPQSIRAYALGLVVQCIASGDASVPIVEAIAQADAFAEYIVTGNLPKERK